MVQTTNVCPVPIALASRPSRSHTSRTARTATFLRFKAGHHEYLGEQPSHRRSTGSFRVSRASWSLLRRIRAQTWDRAEEGMVEPVSMIVRRYQGRAGSLEWRVGRSDQEAYLACQAVFGAWSR